MIYRPTEIEALRNLRTWERVRQKLLDTVLDVFQYTIWQQNRDGLNSYQLSERYRLPVEFISDELNTISEVLTHHDRR